MENRLKEFGNGEGKDSNNPFSCDANTMIDINLGVNVLDVC
jgi:hypothetical protein